MIRQNLIESKNGYELIEIVEIDEDGNEKHLDYKTVEHGTPALTPTSIDAAKEQ